MNPRRPLPLLFVLALCGTAAAAEEKPPSTGLLRIQAVGRPRRDCWLYVPSTYNRAKRYPLVVVLHPAGLTGATLVRTWGEVAERTGAFIVAGPECKDRKRRRWSFDDERDLLATIKKVMALYSVDPARVLLTGFSQGAVYTYTFGLRNPGVFRAIAPVAGALIAGQSPAAEAILRKARGMGVYIAHGAIDQQIPVVRARASRARLEKAGFVVTYHEMPYMGHHFPPEEAPRIWAWFQKLTAGPTAKRKPANQRP